MVLLTSPVLCQAGREGWAQRGSSTVVGLAWLDSWKAAVPATQQKLYGVSDLASEVIGGHS